MRRFERSPIQEGLVLPADLPSSRSIRAYDPLVSRETHKRIVALTQINPQALVIPDVSGTQCLVCVGSAPKAALLARSSNAPGTVAVEGEARVDTLARCIANSVISRLGTTNLQRGSRLLTPAGKSFTVPSHISSGIDFATYDAERMDWILSSQQLQALEQRNEWSTELYKKTCGLIKTYVLDHIRVDGRLLASSATRNSRLNFIFNVTPEMLSEMIYVSLSISASNNWMENSRQDKTPLVVTIGCALDMAERHIYASISDTDKEKLDQFRTDGNYDAIDCPGLNFDMTWSEQPVLTWEST